MPMGVIAIVATVAPIVATIARRSRQIWNRVFAGMTLALAPPGRIQDFPMGRRGTRPRPRLVFDTRTTAPSVAGNDVLLRIAVKIDGCSATTRRRELLDPVPRKVAARDLVVPLAGCKVTRRIYGIHVRARSRRATRFTMMVGRWIRGLRDLFYRSDSFAVVRRSRRYVASAFEKRE